jgi:two-component system cell cycle response regulator
VTVSIGVAATLGASDHMDALLKRADLALYEAKAAGRNQVISKAA